MNENWQWCYKFLLCSRVIKVTNALAHCFSVCTDVAGKEPDSPLTTGKTVLVDSLLQAKLSKLVAHENFNLEESDLCLNTSLKLP